jgi:hypothetical protein
MVVRTYGCKSIYTAQMHAILTKKWFVQNYLLPVLFNRFSPRMRDYVGHFYAERE